MIPPKKALDLAHEYLAEKNKSDHGVQVVTDTSDFFRVDYNHVLLLDTGAYLIQGLEREGRFGLDEEPKHWVKKAIDLTSGERKVIKLVFFEKFDMTIGRITYQCFRSPKKEGRILNLVRGLPNFMQGISTLDDKGNNVRIIDFVSGPSLAVYVEGLKIPHDEYYREMLPGLLDRVIPAFEGLSFLHRNMEKHGDVRRDHLIRARDGRLVWIDFDYNYKHGEYIAGLDLAGVGNILAFLAGGGDMTVQAIRSGRPEVYDRLRAEDMSLVFENRLMNLKKMYPYLSETLNRVLLHFSAGAENFYDSVDQLLLDLGQAREEMS